MLSQEDTHLFFAVRITHAIVWVRLLLHGLVKDDKGTAMLLEKWTSLASRSSSTSFAIRTDASPFGMGAMLLVDGRPAAWIATHWSHEDAEFLQAMIGDAAWQAEWELFAILIAIDQWLPVIR